MAIHAKTHVTVRVGPRIRLITPQAPGAPSRIKQGAVDSVACTTQGAACVAIIGEIVEEHPGRVVLQTLLGAHRIIDMLVGEPLPRIC